MEMNQIKNELDYWTVTSWLLYHGENHPKKVDKTDGSCLNIGRKM